MKNLFKKNQLMITALAIMIAIAGYLQFAGTDLEEEFLVRDGETEAVDADSVVTEKNTAENIISDYELDGLTDLSEEDILNAEGLAGLNDIESLDSDAEVIVEDYLAEGMEESLLSQEGQTDVALAEPDEEEIPGEAVFTSSTGTSILSEAKMIKEQTRAKNKETLMEIIESSGLTEEQKQTAVNSMVAMTDVAEREAAAEILLEAKGFHDVVVSINAGAVDVVVNETALDDVMRAQIEDIVKRKTGVDAANIIISTVVQ